MLKKHTVRIGMKKVIVITAIVVAVAVGILFATDAFGISANNLEEDARKNQRIGIEWAVSKSINEKLGAMIFYNDTLDSHIFSIYVKRGGLSFGYFFRAGGSDSQIANGIREFNFPTPYDINGSALISMNKDNVVRIEIDNDVEIIVINVDPNKPFAVVIPINPGSVTLYDVDDNIVSINASGS